ncbi:T9SS type A sorting domain-containing protein [Flavobacterium nackdongense]|uniref:T9SS type A sorting domain-containing protein n=1 Tax=Flavobacterium nackdongense TaxID=2547394 RepID=A0A4P6Y9H1_9FLAO|nr:T9SS type A sorting domain-containing protein [Flavobacterium nackdongense]QBN19616.1 T9SS type A sorting domain-containing protein [Flavobacterium nackdongense]
MKHLYPKLINLFIVMILFFSLKGISQTSQPITNDTMETFISSGENAAGTAGSVTYSIGQVFYTYIGESVYNVTQGIQQEEAITTLSSEENSIQPRTEIFIFPNPTTDYININMDGYEPQSTRQAYQLYDLQGRLIKQETISQSETQIDVTNLSSAIYLLQVYNENKILKTFKIVKN